MVKILLPKFKNYDTIKLFFLGGIRIGKEEIKAKMAEYIDDTIEYAAACIELSLLAAEEAKLAILEAASAEQEYEEKYGEE